MGVTTTPSNQVWGGHRTQEATPHDGKTDRCKGLRPPEPMGEGGWGSSGSPAGGGTVRTCGAHLAPPPAAAASAAWAAGRGAAGGWF